MKRRGNYDGSWYKRPTGLWQYRISYIDSTGASVRKSFYARTKRECMEKVDNFSPESIPTQLSLIVSEWADEWLRVYKAGVVGPSTYNQWEILIRVYLKPSIIGNMHLSEVKPLHVEAAMKEIRTKSRSYQEKMRTLLHSIFDKGIANGLCSVNPCTDIKIKKESKRLDREKYFTQEEVRLILDRCNIDLSMPALGAAIMLYSGIRRGELLGLQWSDFDFDNNIIHINRVAYLDNNSKRLKNKGKSVASIRDIPMHPTLKKHLQETAKRSLFVIYDTNFDFYNPKNYGTMFKKFIGSIDGVRTLGTHACRHALGTMLRRNNVPIEMIREILGHEDSETTMIYAQSDMKLEMNALMKLPY